MSPHTSSPCPRCAVGDAIVGAVVLSCALLLAACGATVRSAAVQVPRIAVPVAIDEALKSFGDADTQARIADMMATPEMQRIVREFGVAMAQGGIDGASSQEMNERFTRLSVIAGEGLARALASAADSMTRTWMRASADELPDTIGPALRRSLVTELRSPELQGAIAETVANITRQALTSSRDVIAGLPAQPHVTGLVDRIDHLLTLVWVLAIAFAAGAGVLFVKAITSKRRAGNAPLDAGSQNPRIAGELPMTITRPVRTS
jgi:hypothetical protein